MVLSDLLAERVDYLTSRLQVSIALSPRSTFLALLIPQSLCLEQITNALIQDHEQLLWRGLLEGPWYAVGTGQTLMAAYYDLETRIGMVPTQNVRAYIQAIHTLYAGWYLGQDHTTFLQRLRDARLLGQLTR